MYRKILFCVVVCLMVSLGSTRDLAGDDSVTGAYTLIQEEPLSDLPVADLKPLAPEVEPAEEATFAYSKFILPVADKYGIDWRLVAAVIEAESGFDARAVSPMGAIGLMQIMPSTAASYGFKRSEMYDPAKNVEVGIRHLKMLHERYKGDVKLVLAAYNTGEGAVDRYHDVPPYKATRHFVNQVMQSYTSSRLAMQRGFVGTAAR